LIIKTSEISKMGDNRYRGLLINGLSGLKSAHLIGTKSSDGVENLALFSSVFHLGADPSLMGMIVRPDVSPRHTYSNILNSKTYTINTVESSFFVKAHHTSARFPKDVSEFNECGLSSHYHDGICAPFVMESRLKWGMNLVEVINITHNGTHLIIGEVTIIDIEEGILGADGHINFDQINPVVVSGLDEYHSVNSGTRLTYAKPEHSPTVKV